MYIYPHSFLIWDEISLNMKYTFGLLIVGVFSFSFISCEKIDTWIQGLKPSGSVNSILDSMVTVYAPGTAINPYYKRQTLIYGYNSENKCNVITRNNWLFTSPYFEKDTTFYWKEADTIFKKSGIKGVKAFFMKVSSDGKPLSIGFPRKYSFNAKTILSQLYIDTSYTQNNSNYDSLGRNNYSYFVSFNSTTNPSASYPVLRYVDSISIVETSTYTSKGESSKNSVIGYNSYVLNKTSAAAPFTLKNYNSFIKKPDGSNYSGKCYERYLSSFVYSDYVLPHVEMIYKQPVSNLLSNATVIHSFSIDRANWTNYPDQRTIEYKVVKMTKNRVDQVDQFENGSYYCSVYYYYH